MRAPRPCLVCGTPTRNPGGRCRPHELEHQRARNQARKNLYDWDHRQLSRLMTSRQPWCSICGRRRHEAVLTWDHEHRQVECRECNSRHRRSPT